MPIKHAPFVMDTAISLPMQENNYDDLIFHKKQDRRESIAAANSCILYDRAVRA